MSPILDVAAGTGDRLYASGAHFDEHALLVWRSKNGSLEPAGVKIGDVSISPDGRLLAVGEARGLRIRDLGSLQSERTVYLPGNPRSPRWYADGNRIRFSVFEPASLSTALWEVRRNGSDLHRLPIPTEHGRHLFSEGWTADGRYFIFSEYGDLDHHANLWIEKDDARARPIRLTSAFRRSMWRFPMTERGRHLRAIPNALSG